MLGSSLSDSAFILPLQDATQSTTDKIEDWFLDHGVVILAIAIFVAIAVVFIDILIPRLVRGATKRRLADKDDEEVEQRIDTLSHVFTRTGTALLVLLGFVTMLPERGVNIGPLIAGAGIAGIAIGFEAQSMAKDFLTGIFILTDNQYGRGDVVKIAGISGVVQDLGIRRTVVRDLDGIVHYVPNGSIAVTSNYSEDLFARQLEHRRFVQREPQSCHAGNQPGW